jgi:hypothetical protein
MEKYIKREIEDEVLKQVGIGFIVAILGARQVGKTTVINHIKENLIRSGVSSSFIFYFSFDDPILRAKVASSFYFIKEYIEDSLGKELDNLSQPIYLFLDEAQKVPSIFELLKIFYDRYKEKIRIIISGSASLEIQKKVVESLAGRVSYLFLYPLSIREIIEDRITKNLPNPLWKDIDKLSLEYFKVRQSLLFRKQESLECILRRILIDGTMPGVFTRENREEKQLVLQSFTATYLDKDIRSLSEIGNLDNFSQFLSLLSFEIGNLLNLSSISKDLGIAVNTLKKYYSVLTNTFVINPLNPYFRPHRKKLVKSKKLYFFDIGVANFLTKREVFEHLIASKSLGAVFENLILKEFESYNKNRAFPYNLFFWRDYSDREIDFIIEIEDKIVGIEVTYQDKMSNEKRRNFEHFFQEFPQALGILVYRGKLQEIKFNSSKVICLPWWLWW